MCVLRNPMTLDPIPIDGLLWVWLVRPARMLLARASRTARPQLLCALPPQVRKLGPKADPAVLKTLPLASGAMWLFYFS